MTDISEKVAVLKAKVAAASEELDKAIAFHEAWRPRAYDVHLHQRMDRSYATNTFEIIRAALRREILLALVRLWDRQLGAVSMETIGNTLKDKRVLDWLAREIEAHWVDNTLPQHVSVDVSADDKIIVNDAIRGHMARTAYTQSAAMRKAAEEAQAIIVKYVTNGEGKPALDALRKIRNQWLAHREVGASLPSASDHADMKTDEFYSDMLILVRALRLAVEHIDYRPGDTAAIRRRHAEVFWRGVRGERTEGHPDYRPVPARILREQ